VKGLNVDGEVDERAILPYYMPAVLAETLQRTKARSKEHRRRALTSVMRYLAKVFDQSPKAVMGGDSPTSMVSDVSWPVGGVVIEHNMKMVLDFIQTDKFAEDPDWLDELDIPPAQPLQRRRTSHSLASGDSSDFLPKRTVSRSSTALSAPPAPIKEGEILGGLFRYPFSKR
jgi:hypothetical protein